MSSWLLIHCVVLIAIKFIECSYSKDLYHETFAFIYDHKDYVHSKHHLLNMPWISLSVSHDTLYMVLCDGMEQTHSLINNTKYYLKIELDQNMFELMINNQLMANKICKTRQISKFGNKNITFNANLVKVWRTDSNSNNIVNQVIQLTIS